MKNVYNFMTYEFWKPILFKDIYYANSALWLKVRHKIHYKPVSKKCMLRFNKLSNKPHK